MEENILTADQVAQKLQVHPFTVLKFIKQGKLKASKLGRVYRIRESDVTRFLDEQQTAGVKNSNGAEKSPVKASATAGPAGSKMAKPRIVPTLQTSTKEISQGSLHLAGEAKEAAFQKLEVKPSINTEQQSRKSVSTVLPQMAKKTLTQIAPLQASPKEDPDDDMLELDHYILD